MADSETEASKEIEEVIENSSAEPEKVPTSSQSNLAEAPLEEIAPTEATTEEAPPPEEPIVEKAPSEAQIANEKSQASTEKITVETELSGTKIEDEEEEIEKKTSDLQAGGVEISASSKEIISEDSFHKKSRSESLAKGSSQKRLSGIIDRKLTKSKTDRLNAKAKAAVGSAISIHRLSATGDMYDRKSARYMNSYKLSSDNPFSPDKIKKILEKVMVETLESLTYDPDKCVKQAKWASSAIRTKVKELQFDRYKLICLVTIGEKNSQDVYVTCRFLWDVDRDRYAHYCIENTYVFGIAQCFGIYYE